LTVGLTVGGILPFLTVNSQQSSVNLEGRMTTKLEKVLKREVDIDGEAYIVAISPEGLKLTVKGKRKGQELLWKDLVSGQAALATALNASLEKARS
jgi:hypothetical protein